MPATELTAGTIDYEGTSGHGPVIVLLGGAFVDGSVCGGQLRRDHRCAALCRLWAPLVGPCVPMPIGRCVVSAG
jgi:hypothetical protein